jgi:hypothetical protein
VFGKEWAGMPGVPGLMIEGVGVVGLPLNPIMAQAIAKVRGTLKIAHATGPPVSAWSTNRGLLRLQVATRAPFGKGGETLVDESVRKTLQVAASKVRFENPA